MTNDVQYCNKIVRPVLKNYLDVLFGGISNFIFNL